MMENKDLFDLFRDNEHKLAQQPSDQAWSRIQQRLQAAPAAEPRPSAHRLHVRHLVRVVVVAASIALVLGLAVSYLWVTDTSADTLAELQGNVVPLEELTLLPAPASVPATALAVAPAAKQRPARPIREGVAGQRLIVKTEAAPPPAAPNPTYDTARQERPQRVGR